MTKEKKMVVKFEYIMNRLNEKLDYVHGQRDVWIALLHKNAEEIEDFMEWGEEIDKAKRSYQYARDCLFGMMEAYELIIEDLGGRKGNFRINSVDDSALDEKIVWEDWD